MKILKVISGGQTGADRGGLNAAMDRDIPVGGWCPKGRKSEDGKIPDRYPLKEHKSPEYPPRTAANVKDSDGTVVYTFGPAERGSALTISLCKKIGRPCLHLDLKKLHYSQAVAKTALFVKRNQIKVLNVAGNRESKSPGIGMLVQKVIGSVIVDMNKLHDEKERRAKSWKATRGLVFSDPVIRKGS